MTEISENKSERHGFLPKKLKKPLLVMAFVALNVAVIAATAANEFGNSREAAKLSEININWWLIIPAAVCFIVAITLEIGKYALMLHQMEPKALRKKNDEWKIARRTVLLGRYYDNITPAAVGGQPFQIYFMRKNANISNGLATTIPIFGMISLQIAFILIALVCFIFGGLAESNAALAVTAWIGLAFYAFWPVVIGMATFYPKATTGLIKFVVKILSRLKIVKDKEAALKKTEQEVKEYVKCVKMILKRRKLFILIILMSLVFNILMAAIPFFLLTAFGGQMDFAQCFTLTIAVMSAVYFIPTPGNSGAAEGTFYLVFSALSSGYVFWAMLFWRFFSYYIYIIMGPITYFFMHLEKKRATQSSAKKPGEN